MNLNLDIDYLICVSDLHAGSVYGLMPPSVKLYDDNIVKANVFQRWMYKCWQDWWEFADHRTKGKRVAIALVGDAIEGIHHGGKQVVSPRRQTIQPSPRNY